MATTEHTINDALAESLRQTRHQWRVTQIISSENTGMLKGCSGQPDILVAEPDVSPVIIETEIFPAITVEAEAINRLGQRLRHTGRAVMSSVAVRLPITLRDMHGSKLQEELSSCNFEMALYTGQNPTSYTRWPRSGWIGGNIFDLSIITQMATVPPEIIDEAANLLIDGVKEAAGLLEGMASSNAGAIHKISEELRQEDGEQTRRMAVAILANAFMFQERLAGGPGELGDVKSVEELRGTTGDLNKSAILSEWRKILKVNYWPIFDIARRILEVIPATGIKPFIEGITTTADKLLENRLMNSHDLTGAVFQRLIADRKFLAAYYTTPASAALLVGLTINQDALPINGLWSNPDDVRGLRIADFACGTGTLLSTAYQRIGLLFEFAGGNSETIHSEMMAGALNGCDVLPAATHLTASMLAGAHPTLKYNQSSILTLAYGKQPDGTIELGSLSLLDHQGMFEIIPITAKSLDSMGEAEKRAWFSMQHASFDAVVMNPPFTRATGHEGKKIGVPNPMFAAFSSSAEEQRLMSKATQRLTAGTSAHGNAGEASIFLVLADRKLREGGMLGLVMPLSILSGEAWEQSRALLAKNYTDIIVVTIAGSHGSRLSFSADTGMGECLVIGRKAKDGCNRGTFIILNEPPAYPLLGLSIAEQIRRLMLEANRCMIEDGPSGGDLIRFGDDIVGQMLDAPLTASGGWNLSRVADLSIAQTAFQLSNQNRVWLPTMNSSPAIHIPMTTIATIGNIGPYHADINGKTSTGTFRGPFTVIPKKNSIPTYPVLWAHDASSQKALCFDADCEGFIRRAGRHAEQEVINQKAENVWGSASHCHFNRDFRFNSQSTSMQFTSRKTIGGRAWPSISLATVEQEKTLVLWANTSLGCLMHWWYANKQQEGRGSIGILALQNVSVLDVTRLDPEQISNATGLFDSMNALELRPLHEINIDPVRKELDEQFCSLVLRLPDHIISDGGPLELLRMKLSQEPSIVGHKSRE